MANVTVIDDPTNQGHHWIPTPTFRFLLAKLRRLPWEDVHAILVQLQETTTGPHMSKQDTKPDPPQDEPKPKKKPKRKRR